MISYEELFDKIINEVEIKNDDFVYGITFIGPPGVGKSTIAKLISQRLGMHVSSNDKIRRMLDSLGIDAALNQPLLERLAYEKTAYMLQNNTSIIIDANCLTAYKKVDENFAKYNSECLYIKLDCSEREVLRRISDREKNFGKNDNYSRGTKRDYDNYLNRLKNNPFPIEKIFFTINTEEKLEPQVDKLVEKINDYINNKKNKKVIK